MVHSSTHIYVKLIFIKLVFQSLMKPGKKNTRFPTSTEVTKKALRKSYFIEPVDVQIEWP